NDEQESISRIRVLAPYFAANEIYPLFLTWKTGVGEVLGDLVQDWVRKITGLEAERVTDVVAALGEAKDRAVEALARTLGRGIWSEMRENVEEARRLAAGMPAEDEELRTQKKQLEAKIRNLVGMAEKGSGSESLLQRLQEHEGALREVENSL